MIDAHAAPDRDRSRCSAPGRALGRARCRTPTEPARWSAPDAAPRGWRGSRRIRSWRAPHVLRSSAIRLGAPLLPELLILEHSALALPAACLPARHPFTHPLHEVLRVGNVHDAGVLPLAADPFQSSDRPG